MADESLDEAIALVNAGQHDKALDSINRYLAINSSPRALLLKAELLAKQGQHQPALTALLPLLDQTPLIPKAEYLAGLEKKEVGDFAGAADHLRRAASDPFYAGPANYELGDIYNEYGETRNTDLAIHYFRRAVAATNAPADAYLQLALLENKERATGILRKGREDLPASETLVIRLIHHLWSKLGNPADALRELEGAFATGMVTPRLLFLHADLLASLGRYDEATRSLNQITGVDDEGSMIVEMMRAVIAIDTADFGSARSILRSLITQDIENRLGFGPQLLLFATETKAQDWSVAAACLDGIDPFEVNDFSGSYSEDVGAINWDKHVVVAIDEFVAHGFDQRSVATAVALKLHRSQFIGHRDPVSSISDIETAKFRWPRDSRLFVIEGQVLQEVGEPAKAFLVFLKAQALSTTNLYIPWKELVQPLIRTKSGRKDLIRSIDQAISEDFVWNGRANITRFALGDIVGTLHSLKAYSAVGLLADRFYDKEFAEANVVFEAAYTLGHESGDDKRKTGRAIRLYESLLAKKRSVGAAANNVGLLYEKRGQLDDAVRVFKMAVEADPNGEKPANSLKRVESLLAAAASHEVAYAQALHFFQQEDEGTRITVERLYSNKAPDGLIHVKREALIKILGANSFTLDDRLRPLLKRRYFDLASGEQTSAELIRIQPHPAIEVFVNQVRNRRLEDESIAALASALTSDQLDKRLGYSQELINQLQVVSDDKLRAQLQRDLAEAAKAITLGLHKSALILSGSIAEALLYDRLKRDRKGAVEALKDLRKKQQRPLQSKDKDPKEWGLETLLEVAQHVGVIQSNLYYFGHGIRGFRNLVHPAVELRGPLEVSEGNAAIAWTVVKDLLRSLNRP